MAETRRPIRPVSHSITARQRLCLFGTAVLLLAGLGTALRAKYDQAGAVRGRPLAALTAEGQR